MFLGPIYAAALAWALWDEARADTLLLWLACHVVVSLYWLYLTYQYQSDPAGREKTRYYLLRAQISAVVSGLVWGLIATLYLDLGDTTSSHLISLMLVTVNVAPLVAISSLPRLFFSFMPACLLQLVGVGLWQMTAVNAWHPILVLSFVGGVCGLLPAHLPHQRAELSPALQERRAD